MGRDNFGARNQSSTVHRVAETSCPGLKQIEGGWSSGFAVWRWSLPEVECRFPDLLSLATGQAGQDDAGKRFRAARPIWSAGADPARISRRGGAKIWAMAEMGIARCREVLGGGNPTPGERSSFETHISSFTAGPLGCGGEEKNVRW